VNYVIPAGTAPGAATVTIRPAAGRVSTAPLEVDTVEPGLLLTGGYWWPSPPAGLIVRVRDGVQTVEPIDRGVDASGDFVPVDLGPETDRVYLVLFGTGLRFHGGLANVSVKIADIEMPVECAGPQSEYVGLDQVNVLLNRSLPRLTDWLPLQVQVNGKLSNTGFLRFQ
jgi:uncharacterized protein (TIGR03437 family)